MKLLALFKNDSWRKVFHRNYLYLTGIVCTIVLGRMLPGMALAGLILVLLTGFLLWQKLYRETLMLAAASVAGLLAVAWQNFQTEDLRDCRLENAVVSITDSAAIGTALASNDLFARRVKARYNNKTIQLYIPDKMIDPGLWEGKSYYVTGNLYALSMLPEYYIADKAGKWQDSSRRFCRSSYNGYLALNKICGILPVEKITPVGSQQTINVSENKQGFISNIRRNLTLRLDHKLEDPINRAILGAVTLGLRHRMSGGEKKFYASVGLAHLFSISGLHVGVLAMLILLLLRPLPAYLHIPLVGTLVCYVMAAGGNAPAIRAFVMVLALVIFRAYFLRCRTLEVLSMICAVFLLINPLYLTDGGFLYSFVITAVLIKSSELGKSVVQCFSGAGVLAGELTLFQRRLARWRGRAAGAVFFAAIASSASLALTLFFQNMFFAGSMMVNLMILPVLLPLYLFAIGKIIVPDWADVWNFFLNGMVDYLRFIARIGNEFAGNSEIMHISYLTVLIFTVLLMLFLILAYKKSSILVLALLLGTLSFMHIRSSFAPQKVCAVIWGGKLTEPVAAVILPQAHSMYLLNCGNDAVPLVLDAAAAYGISQIDRLDFGKPVSACVNGIEFLINNIPVREYRKSHLPVRSKVFKEKTGVLMLKSGAKINSLSINDLPEKCDIMFTEQPDGTLAMHTQGRLYKIERSKYPAAYIVECCK